MKETVETNSNRLFTMSVRFSEEQRKLWKKIARQNDCSLSALIRKSVIQSLKEGVPSKQETEALIAIIRGIVSEQNAIGNNLNQLTKHANSTGEISSRIHDLLDEIDSINSQIYKILITIQETEHRKVGQYNPPKKKVQANDYQN